jgi:DNA-binding CsgD family transcriptional regulator/tetratricopeptide (TPR) repeat protein
MYTLSPAVRARAGRRALALDGITPQMRARHLAQLVTNLVGGGEVAAADASVEAARVAVAASGDAPAAALLEVTELTLGAAHARHAAVVERCDRVIAQRAGELDDPRTQFARLMRSTALRQLGDLDASLAASDLGFLTALRQGQGWAVRMGQEGRGIILLELGRIAEAIAVLESLFRPAPPVALPNVARASAFVALARAALHAGEARLAALCTTIAERTAQSDTPEMRRHATWVLALQAHGRGEVATAHRHLSALGADADEAILPRYPSCPSDVVALVRLAVAGGDAGLARDTVALARARAGDNPTSAYLQGLADHAGGLARGDVGLLQTAAERLADTAAPLALASALEDLGAHRGPASAVVVQRLDRALAIYESAGAAWDAARVRGRLRTLGVRRITASPRVADGDLTEAERRVVDLVAAGLTNRDVAERLYVSPHTVHTHLRHAFAKLGVRSRRELILQVRS